MKEDFEYKGHLVVYNQEDSYDVWATSEDSDANVYIGTVSSEKEAKRLIDTYLK